MSYLIVGGTAEERLQRAKEVSNIKYQVSSFDTIYIVGETSISIEQIRDLQHQLSLKPYNSSYKVALLHPAELLTVEAQNAMLKILEEPNETSVLILTAPQPESLLPTIVSRCQIIKLSPQIKTNFDETTLNAYHTQFNTIINSGAGERLKIASTVGKGKEEIKEWLENLLVVLREVLLHPRHPEFISGSVSIVQIIRSVQQTLFYLDQNVNPRLSLEIFLLDLPKSPDVANLGNSRC